MLFNNGFQTVLCVLLLVGLLSTWDTGKLKIFYTISKPSSFVGWALHDVPLTITC